MFLEFFKSPYWKVTESVIITDMRLLPTAIQMHSGLRSCILISFLLVLAMSPFHHLLKARWKVDNFSLGNFSLGNCFDLVGSRETIFVRLYSTKPQAIGMVLKSIIVSDVALKKLHGPHHHVRLSISQCKHAYKILYSVPSASVSQERWFSVVKNWSLWIDNRSPGDSPQETQAKRKGAGGEACCCCWCS